MRLSPSRPMPITTTLPVQGAVSIFDGAAPTVLRAGPESAPKQPGSALEDVEQLQVQWHALLQCQLTRPRQFV